MDKDKKTTRELEGVMVRYGDRLTDLRRRRDKILSEFGEFLRRAKFEKMKQEFNQKWTHKKK
jgi:hypothetical protein